MSRSVGSLACLTLLAAALPTTLSFLARRHWALDNLTSFLPQYALAAAVCLPVFLWRRRPGWAAATVLLLALNAFRLMPNGTGAEPPEGRPLELVSANVNFANRAHDRFLNFIRREDPDVFLVVEVDPEWAAALERLKDRWPHAVVVPRDDPFGIALFSRTPFTNSEVTAADGTGFPSIVARVTHQGRPVTVVGTHPPPPNFAAAAERRNRQLASLARFAREAEGEVLLMGDLNVSPWSPHFRDLLRVGRLHDTRAGIFPQTTWPASLPPLLTPIDHVLVSEGLAILDRRVGPEIGSDHYPVIARVAFRRLVAR